MDKKFVGKRVEVGVYDDACGFTPEERETYHNMLVNRSFDTGCNFFEGGFWMEGEDSAEFVVNAELSNESMQKIIDNLIKELDKANG